MYISPRLLVLNRQLFEPFRIEPKVFKVRTIDFIKAKTVVVPTTIPRNQGGREGGARVGPGPPNISGPSPKKGTIAEGDPQKVDTFNHFEISRRTALHSVCYCFDKME